MLECNGRCRFTVGLVCLLRFQHAQNKSLALAVAGAERNKHMAASLNGNVLWNEIAIDAVDVCMRNVNNDLADRFHAVHLALPYVPVFREGIELVRGIL